MRPIERWLAAADADAEGRGLPELKPLLRGLAASTAALRAAAWNARADDAAPSEPCAAEGNSSRTDV